MFLLSLVLKTDKITIACDFNIHVNAYGIIKLTSHTCTLYYHSLFTLSIPSLCYSVVL